MKINITIDEYLDIVEDKLEELRLLEITAKLGGKIQNDKLNILAWEADVNKYTLGGSMIRFNNFINGIIEQFELGDNTLSPVDF